MVFLPYSTNEEGVFPLFSNFGTVSAILKIQSTKRVRISPGLTKYTPIIHICRYTDQKTLNIDEQFF